jgi:hypothetical protein
MNYRKPEIFNSKSDKFFNHLPIEEQLSFLEENFPIGEIFHWTDFMGDDRVLDYTCKIVGYTKIVDAHFILQIENIGDSIRFRENNQFETIHPGFFYPNKQFLRNRIIKEIGI